MLMCVVGLGSAAAAQPADRVLIGPKDAQCACLFESRRIAESQGRIDFSVAVDTLGNGATTDVTAYLRMGSPYAVGRIQFTGHTAINDSTLRRAMTLRERDLFDVGELRRSLARLNDIGFAAPLTLADVIVSRDADGATADVTIPFRERGRRWWSLSGPIIPGFGSFDATIASRLPPWGRGVFETSTYLVSFNVLAAVRPLLGLMPFLSKAPPALVALERPYLPGQGLLSGFALSPALSARTTLSHYGRSHLGRGVRALLEPETTEPLAVPMADTEASPGTFLVCEPPKPRWVWLRRGVIQAFDLALAAVLP